MKQVTIECDYDVSVETGRNGTFAIEGLSIEVGDTIVCFDGIGKRGLPIHGGIRVNIECWEELKRQIIQGKI